MKIIIVSFLLLCTISFLSCDENTPVDHFSPFVKIINPQMNSTIADSTTIKIITNINEIVRLELYIDQGISAVFEQPPFEYFWYTRYYQDGSQHILNAKAYNKSGNSFESKFVIVNVYRFQPSYLTASIKADTLIELNWIDNCNFETGFEIECSVNDSNFTKISSVDSNVTSFDVNGIFNLDDIYYFRVRAIAGSNVSGYSNIAVASVSLNTPTDLNFEFISDTAAVLSWNDNNDFETGYTILKFIPNYGNTIIKQIPPNSTQTVIKDTFITGQNYNYSIYATMGSLVGESAHFPFVSFYFPAPENLIVEGISENSLKLTWEDVNNYDLGYIVQRSNDGNNFFELGRTSANDISFIDTNLDTALGYTYRLAAFSSHNQSSYSVEIDAYYLPYLNNINKFSVSSAISWMRLSYDASIVAFGGYYSNNPAIYIYDTFSGQRIKTLYTADSTSWIFTRLTISPDNNLIAAGGDNGYVTVWNTNTGEVVKRIYNIVTPNVMMFSYDGNHLIVERGGILRFYDIQSWQYEDRVTTSNYITSMDIDQNQNVIATGDGSSNIKIWDYDTGILLREISSTANAQPLQLNKTGTRLYAVLNHELLSWDVNSGSNVSTIQNFWGWSYIAINETKNIASGSINSGVGLWQLSSGIYTQKYTTGNQTFGQMFITPDETYLIGQVGIYFYRIMEICREWGSPLN